MSIADLKVILSIDISYKIFKNAKGSTDIEQQILNVALQDPKIILQKQSITVYTDCQKTQSNDNYKVEHVKGHTKQINRNNNDKIFDVIDKASRKYLRKIIKETKI